MYIIWGCLRNGARACIARHGQWASCTISHVPYKFPSFSDPSQIWKASVDKLIWRSWNPRLQQPVAHVSLLVHSRCTRPIEQKGWAASFIGRVWGLKDSRMRSVKSAPTSRCKRVCFSRGTRDRSGAEQLRVFFRIEMWQRYRWTGERLQNFPTTRFDVCKDDFVSWCFGELCQTNLRA